MPRLDVGTLSAAWIDADHGGCGERLLGLLDNSTLTFGPTHDPADTNPYFIALASAQTSNLAVSMQSSISSQQLVQTWWDVNARLESGEGDYSVSGTLKNDTSFDKNSFSGSFGKAASGWCGLDKQTFIWKYQVDTSTFSGTISPTEAVFSIDGSMLDEDTNRLISYVIQFHGKWNSQSAKLSLDKPIPTWPDPGNSTAAEQPQSSSIFLDGRPMPTIDLGAAKDGPDDIKKRKIGLGGIIGITAAAVFVTGFITIAVFCIFRRWKQRQLDGKVYPKIAYIYTPSPNPSLGSSEGYSKVLAHYNSQTSPDLEVREVLVNDHSLPVTNQHQWREF